MLNFCDFIQVYVFTTNHTLIVVQDGDSDFISSKDPIRSGPLFLYARWFLKAVKWYFLEI